MARIFRKPGLTGRTQTATLMSRSDIGPPAEQLMTDLAEQPAAIFEGLRRLPGLERLLLAIRERSRTAGWRFLSESRHTPALERARAQTLSTRVRYFAGSLAALTVALVIIDLLLFDRALPAWPPCGQ